MSIILKPPTAASFGTKPMTVGTGSKSMASVSVIEPQLLAQVNDRAGRVRDALKSSIAKCDGKFLGGKPASAAASALRALQPRVDSWATRGELAAKSGRAPMSSDGKTPTTWAKWIDSGEVFLSGINDITNEGLNTNLELIKTSVAEIPADTQRAVTTIAKTAATVVQETADVASSAASSLIRPLLLPLAIVAVGLVAFAVIKSGGASRG